MSAELAAHTSKSAWPATAAGCLQKPCRTFASHKKQSIPRQRQCPYRTSIQTSAYVEATALTAEQLVKRSSVGKRQSENCESLLQWYAAAESTLQNLITTPHLDEQLRTNTEVQRRADAVLSAVQEARVEAFSVGTDSAVDTNSAHLFLQRVLYRINRLVFFWYDDLSNYDNERSTFLVQLRNDVERDWQSWEDVQFMQKVSDCYAGGKLPALPEEVKQELQRLAESDTAETSQSHTLNYISNELDLPGYRNLLAITSLDGLVEASRQSRVCGGVGNDISCMVFRVLSEEYGNGRLNKKHSTVFGNMMSELGLNNTPEHYFDMVPWQLLRAINHNFLLTERRRFMLRYLGGLTFFELVGPSIYKTYSSAARRIGLDDAAASYWDLHVKEDERHGPQMLTGVALPLVDMYPHNAQEVLQGYLQEKWMGDDAGRSIVEAIKKAEASSSQL